MALKSWPSGDLHIRTDPKFVLRLVNGGLLTMECDGWPGFLWLCCTTSPSAMQLSLLFKHFLFLLCSHTGPLHFQWVKGHSSQLFNDTADHLAAVGCDGDHLFDLSGLVTPPGWVSDHLVLNHQPLDLLTQLAVLHLAPVPIVHPHVSSFADGWSFFMMRSFSAKVDLGLCLPWLWKICVPPGLRELLWKVIFNALPIGTKWSGKKAFGLDYCPCSGATPLSVDHIFSGCPYFPIQDLWHRSVEPALI